MSGDNTANTPPSAARKMNNARARELAGRFPLLGRSVADQPLIYLDSGATSQRPDSVLAAEQEFLRTSYSAVHRGAHTVAVESTEVFEQARHTVADFVGAGVEEIVWTSNATEAINLLTYAFSNATAGSNGAGEQSHRFRVGAGDEILVTESEHHANLVPWQELCARTGATLRWIPADDNGLLDLTALSAVLTERTRVLAFTHVSNVTGAINDVPALVAAAHSVGALTVLDACQSVPHLPVDFRQLGVDFAAFSGHKMLGPTGIGVLYGRQELLNALPTFLAGGSMITSVTMEKSHYLPAPARFEAGTQRISQAVALAHAVKFLCDVGMDHVAAWEAELGQRLAAGIADMPGVRLIGPLPGEERVGLASVVVDGVHAHDVGQLLDAAGIAVRVGHHCAQPLHRRLGVTASTRASAYLYNTTEDIDRFLEELSHVRRYFRLATHN